MHADVLDHLTRSTAPAYTRSVYDRPISQLSHHINHYSEAAALLTTGPRQSPYRHGTAELFNATSVRTDPHTAEPIEQYTEYTHFARNLANNTELRRLPAGYSTPSTHPHAPCIGLYLHGHLIITWSNISRTATNATTSVHYYFPNPNVQTTWSTTVSVYCGNVTRKRFNRFGPSNVHAHMNKHELWITTADGSYRINPLTRSHICVAMNDYHTDNLD